MIARAAESTPLQRLAARYGIETRYVDGLGAAREVSPESLVLLLRAFGAPLLRAEDAAEALREAAEHPAPRLEPVVVSWSDRPAALRLPSPFGSGPFEVEIEREDGARERRSAKPVEAEGGLVLPLPELPLGRHRLRVGDDRSEGETTVVRAPRRCFEGGSGPAPEREWGAFLPLHALRTARDWGAGDFADLRELEQWIGSLGGSTVGLLPLFAVDLDHRSDPSPYTPLSRLFWSELWIAADELPETHTEAGRRALRDPELASERARLRAEPLVDYIGLARVKRRALAALAREFFDAPNDERRKRLESFRKLRPDADDFAAFRAVADARGPCWPEWPERLRDGSVGAADFDEADRRYHLYCQLAAEEQLGALAARRAGADPRERVGLYLDLPVGADSWSYDVWRHRDLFATGVSVGAPPDPLFSLGQNWGFPPMLPHAARCTGHSYLARMLDNLFRHAATVRLDHVMGLHRVFCIPAGAEPVDGAYVRNPAEELHAIVALESVRHRTRVVGEDLGTVPDEVRAAMREHGMRRLWVLQFELGDLGARPPGSALRLDPPAESLACLGTHDTPPFAAFLRGLDLELWHRLGLLDDAALAREREGRRRLREALVGAPGIEPAPNPAERAAEGIAGDDSEDAERRLLRQCLLALAAGPAESLAVTLEDLWLETTPQNVPGTGEEAFNWRRRAVLTLEEMRSDRWIGRLLAEIAALRGSG